ncbi:Elongator subunit elp6 [Coemansia sp. RSA 1813]|nr:Elongator subunit elp6 [Coemansia sp. RSA 1646]KAJ1771403.1 Elongator subunit elp6 [Coemansia sp. RSA 1843]KAJ2213777.1 Elongator subunit elp6 [Coemansia sp. RSA 487]KAJ2569270.1 Elongator subunit elp6 [Coemansia sp. RSA 1813]
MYKTLSSSVNWAQGLPEGGTTTLVCGDIEADGGVLVPHFVQSGLQEASENNVVLVSLTQTMSHYMHIMRKMGVNLAKQRGFQFVNALTLKNVDYSDLPAATRPHFTVTEWSGFFRWLCDSQPPGCTLIIDGLCSLLDQGFGCDFVSGIVDTCQRIIEDKAIKSNGAARLVIMLFLDDFTEPLVRSLIRRSHYFFNFEGLSSGSSTEVAGQLTVVPGHLYCHIQAQSSGKFKPVLLHYRVSDTTVEFFSPGQSRMVL